MEEFYWELTLMSGDKILIPPEYVASVQRKLDAGEYITTSRQKFPAHQVTNFERTSKRKAGTNLLEQAAQAFSEPLTRTRHFKDGTSDEAVSVKWVKKQVTQREWEKYYSPHGYKKINSAGGVVVVAFRCATHLVDTNNVQYCTTDEVERLTK